MVEQNIRDWNDIKNSGKLVAFVDNSTTSYFIYQGLPMGFEYDLLNWFASENNLQLQIKLISNLDSVFDELNSGKADIVAANITITKQRLSVVNFTEPHLLAKQVLVQKMPKNFYQLSKNQLSDSLITDPIQLAGKEVWVRKNSSFYERLQSLSNEIAADIFLVEAPGDLQTEDLIAMVAKGEIEYTVADENIASINKKYFPNLYIETAISFPQKIAWAVNKKSPELQLKLNQWIDSKKNTSDYNTIYLKYFKARTAYSQKVNSNEGSKKGGISVYDPIIKLNAQKFNLDWRLVASLIFQESGFDTAAQSFTGATGLMQILPQTAEEFGQGNLNDPNFNIYVGCAYLNKMQNYWQNKLSNNDEVLKFALASYNVGLGHVLDAQRLAVKYGLNENTWNRNVAEMIKRKSKEEFFTDTVVKYGYCRGEETTKYVSEIIGRYAHYKNLID